nr:radical SAM protein [Candidatus Sigynarchaeota archaeon]
MASISRFSRPELSPDGHPCFDPVLRELKQDAFSIEDTSSAGFSVDWHDPARYGHSYRVYGNVNFSIYSAATCNGRCPFCVERIRPASHGRLLEHVKGSARDVDYFHALKQAFTMVRPLNPSLSITGGEPSIDPRLPDIIALVENFGFRKRTITTNGSGLLRNGFIEALLAGGFNHLNISHAHFDENENQQIMRIDTPFRNKDLETIVHKTSGTQLRPRLSCVLLKGEIDGLDAVVDYLEWAATMGVDNVVFRQLMKFNPRECAADPVIEFSEKNRVQLVPILCDVYQDPLNHHQSFEFTKQVVGYYYYVEVYRYTSKHGKAVDVVFENADLTYINRDQASPRPVPMIQELIFHPNGNLCKSWLPDEGIIAKLV